MGFYMYVYKHVYMHVYVHMYTFIQLYMYTHTKISVCGYSCIICVCTHEAPSPRRGFLQHGGDPTGAGHGSSPRQPGPQLRASVGCLGGIDARTYELVERRYSAVYGMSIMGLFRLECRQHPRKGPSHFPFRGL